MTDSKEDKREIQSLTIPTTRDVEGVVFYVIRVSGANGSWLCQKRYSQFEQLQTLLVSAHGRAFPSGTELPVKRFKMFHSASFIEERRILLENFCRRLLDAEEIGAGTTFVGFFSSDKQAEDEKVTQIEASSAESKLPVDVEITGVTIPSTRVMSDHVLYQIDLENNKKRSSYSRWTVLKRYGQIFEMDAAVRLEFVEQPAVLAEMPFLPARQAKLLISHMDSGFVEQRRVLLENYFNRMLHILPVVRHPIFLAFLGVACD